MRIKIVHRGKQGDLIYSLAAMKGLARERRCVIDLYLRIDALELFDASKARNVRRIAAEQDYIRNVDIASSGRGIHGAIDFSEWLMEGHGQDDNIARSACRYLRVNEYYLKRPWLSIPPAHSGKALFACSNHYPGIYADEFWTTARERFPNAEFIGLPEHHSTFEQRFGPIKHLPTKSLWAAARAISGCEHLVADQGPHLAIAHGLFKAVTVNVAADDPDCIFIRANASYPGVDQATLTARGVHCNQAVD